MIYALPLN